MSHANVHMVDFGIPVKVGGVWIKPGDLVHADQHGVVTIPHEIAPQIPEAIAKVEADEREDHHRLPGEGLHRRTS